MTQEGLRIAIIQQESDVPIDRIVGAEYILFDEDPGEFSLTRGELTYSNISTIRPSTFSKNF